MSIQATIGGYSRFEAYVPVSCSAPRPGRAVAKRLAGKTKSISVGGLALLLPEALPARTAVSVRVWRGDPIQGLVVWVGPGTRTDVQTTFPHGVAFDQPVDSALVREWLSQAKRHPQARVPVRFTVQYTQAGVVGHGTCLNLSRGGMFIATARAALPETEVMLRYVLPGLSDPVSVLARVMWTRGKEAGPGVVNGMGVQFIDLKPSEAALIGVVVDRLCVEELPSPDSFHSPGSFHN